MCRVRDLEHAFLNEMSLSIPSPQGPGNSAEEEAGRLERLYGPEGMEDTEETQRTHSHMSSQRVLQHAWGLARVQVK